MQSLNVEQFYFRTPDGSAAESPGRAKRSKKGFRPLPPPTGPAPYHLNLAAVLPTRTRAVQNAGQLDFHVVGDTGGLNGTGAQQNVADHMTRQIRRSVLPEQPSFLYHLGDVVYPRGEDLYYHDQFYFPYEDYPAPIFAIPGNHDGDTADPGDSLRPFMRHFCAPVPEHLPEAGYSDRPTMTQPNCYWRLDAPFLTVLGLYSNVSGELDPPAGPTPQRDWLAQELRAAPRDRCLLLAVHHPLYSLGKHGETQPIIDAFTSAIAEAGRLPDAVLTGHDHCYQRFTWKRGGQQVPVLVVGAGGFAGYDDLTRVREDRGLPDGVKLKAYDDQRPGFLHLSVTPDALIGRYLAVPGPGRKAKPAKLRDAFTLNLESHRLE